MAGSSPFPRGRAKATASGRPRSAFLEPEETMATVAAIVDQHRREILELWEEEARKAASARGLTRPALMNFIPTYLSSLAQATDQDLGQYTSSRRALVEHHLSARLRQGFDVAEIIEEFALLGRCIARMWLPAPPKTRPEA